MRIYCMTFCRCRKTSTLHFTQLNLMRTEDRLMSAAETHAQVNCVRLSGIKSASTSSSLFNQGPNCGLRTRPSKNICAVYTWMSRTSQGILINRNSSITLTDVNLRTCLMTNLFPICDLALIMEDLTVCLNVILFGLQFSSCKINRFCKPSSQCKYIYEHMNERSKNSSRSGKVVDAISVSQAFIVSVLFFLFFLARPASI